MVLVVPVCVPVDEGRFAAAVALELALAAVAEDLAPEVVISAASMTFATPPRTELT